VEITPLAESFREVTTPPEANTVANSAIATTATIETNTTFFLVNDFFSQRINAQNQTDKP